MLIFRGVVDFHGKMQVKIPYMDPMGTEQKDNSFAVHLQT